MPVVKPIAGHTSARGVMNYLQRDGRELAVDLYNLSWDEDRDADLDQDLKREVDWAGEMDLTRAANGNDTPWRGKRARTYMHFVVSPDPADRITLEQLRELTRAWIRDNWDDYECAAVFHDDNENGVMHAHVVANNTNLATGRRFQNPNPRAMQASIQRLAKERGLSFFVDESSEELHERAEKGRARPRTAQEVYVRRAEREIAGKGGYSWVADIRARVQVAKHIATTPDEFRDVLGTMGVAVSDASARAGRADWLYALVGQGSRRIRGENLGVAFGKRAVEGSMRHNPRPMLTRPAEIAAHAIEVKGYAQLESLARTLEVQARFGIRSMADYDRRIAAMKRRGDEKSRDRLAEARIVAADLELLPDETPRNRPHTRPGDGYASHRDRRKEDGGQSARNRQIQLQRQQSNRERRDR